MTPFPTPQYRASQIERILIDMANECTATRPARLAKDSRQRVIDNMKGEKA